MENNRNSEQAVNVSKLRAERAARTQMLSEKVGHPLYIFARENDAFEKLLENAKDAIKDGSADKGTLESIRGIAIHYARKGDLIYPVLKVRYDISGPSDLMWTDDDEIRDEMTALSKLPKIDDSWQRRFEAVVTEAEKMLYKERNILFPNCVGNFTEEEWIGIYHDSKDYAECFGVKQVQWEEAESKEQKKDNAYSKDEIVMAGGHMTVDQLAALLNTIPLEITFVDADNINRFFNEGPKDFKRPGMAIDRDVFSCHPPMVEQKVRRIIEEFRTGTLDELPVWMEKNGKCMLVKYMAVRDKNNQYIGTLELVQDMGFAKEHFTK